MSIFGAWERVSEVVNIKQAISKAQAKVLGECFNVWPESFNRGVKEGFDLL